MAKENYYKILGLEYDASYSDIKKAYYEKAKLSHPDVRSESEFDFEVIKEAYKNLSDPVLKAEADRALGIQRKFGNSSLAKEFDGYTSKNSLFVRQRPGVLKKFISFLRNSAVSVFAGFSNKNKPSANKSDLSEDINPDTSEFSDSVSFSIYSETSFPLAEGESLNLSEPHDLSSISESIEILENDFRKYPVINNAYLIEARLQSMSDHFVLIVLIDKSMHENWGIDSLRSIQLKKYPEHCPPVLFCSAQNGPFSETIKKFGMKFYSINSSYNKGFTDMAA